MTKRINEAVKNNPEKFPNGYVIEPDFQEITNLRSKIDLNPKIQTHYERIKTQR